MQRLWVVAMALIAVAIVMLVFTAPWWYSAVLAAALIALWFTFPKNKNVVFDELGQYKHVKVDAREVKAYRDEHPDLSLAEATLEVKKRHA